MCGLSLLLAAGIVWSGIVPDHHLCGRPASPGYLQGKVFLVVCRDFSKGKAELERLEDFWQSYKSKPFVLVGSHRGAEAGETKRNLEAAGVTFPVYADATFEAKTFQPESGLIYVIHQGGKMATKTRDMNRAYESVINALTWGAVPTKEQQFRRLIDYELEVLPGKAYLHIKEMRKTLPVEARYYDPVCARLEADEEVKKTARLEEIARRVKDFDPNAKKNGKAVKVSKEKVELIIAEAEALKKSANPLIVQEVKNCIADLKWAMAEI